ncbi:TspO/MBR family protein [Streptomyces sp. HB132]|uniref:TspO/MBR family protein n=1 Tax=Streptomyces sp. HB132 TaxID=767388 RepID=UPI0019610AAD|nr:TspO/MBR family protein [Streptomyces sp. HB132]MBM7439679.1 tryptophan-rich sensory protein [Streptomyces sp. HB132]
MTSPGDTEHPAPGRWLLLLLFLAICSAVAVVGAVAAGDAGSTYTSLRLPGWAPPGWLFGPVWTVLYATIAVAGWLIARTRRPGSRTALLWWSVQLLLNLAWTPLFFGAGQYGLALVDILLLVTALIVTMVKFARLRTWAAVLLAPYLVWVAYASVLNWSIWSANT